MTNVEKSQENAAGEDQLYGGELNNLVTGKEKIKILLKKDVAKKFLNVEISNVKL